MTLSPRTITPILGVAALALFALNFHRYLDYLWQEHQAHRTFSDARHLHIHLWHGGRGDHHRQHRLFIRPEPGERGFSFEIPPAGAARPGEPLRFEFEVRRESRNGPSETVIIERTPPSDL
ncbi:MAG: hypothetical protein SH809_20410 [Rhodothermales bacterium]|nr:hypothetical protein [Rhodothermales bacterium]